MSTEIMALLKHALVRITATVSQISIYSPLSNVTPAMVVATSR